MLSQDTRDSLEAEKEHLLILRQRLTEEFDARIMALELLLTDTTREPGKVEVGFSWQCRRDNHGGCVLPCDCPCHSREDVRPEEPKVLLDEGDEAAFDAITEANLPPPPIRAPSVEETPTLPLPAPVTLGYFHPGAPGAPTPKLIEHEFVEPSSGPRNDCAGFRIFEDGVASWVGCDQPRSAHAAPEVKR